MNVKSTINKLKFPYVFLFQLAHMNRAPNRFAMFDFKELHKDVRAPDEYQLEIYLTAEEVGQFMGGN